MKYYAAYEERYRQVYEQGVKFWTGNPAEIAAVTQAVQQFLRQAGITPADGKILEFGCGEGYLGQALLAQGYDYEGVDLAPSAIGKARLRCPEATARFFVGDITNLPEVATGSCAVGLDRYCLHMLLTDEDRQAYLREVGRVLQPGGVVWFQEVTQEETFPGGVPTEDEFLRRYPQDYRTPEKREAFENGEATEIFLPRIPARFNDEAGYRAELTAAGFDVWHSESTPSDVVLYARKKMGRG